LVPQMHPFHASGEARAWSPAASSLALGSSTLPSLAVSQKELCKVGQREGCIG